MSIETHRCSFGSGPNPPENVWFMPRFGWQHLHLFKWEQSNHTRVCFNETKTAKCEHTPSASYHSNNEHLTSGVFRCFHQDIHALQVWLKDPNIFRGRNIDFGCSVKNSTLAKQTIKTLQKYHKRFTWGFISKRCRSLGCSSEQSWKCLRTLKTKKASVLYRAVKEWIRRPRLNLLHWIWRVASVGFWGLGPCRCEPLLIRRRDQHLCSYSKSVSLWPNNHYANVPQSKNTQLKESV